MIALGSGLQVISMFMLSLAQPHSFYEVPSANFPLPRRDFNPNSNPGIFGASNRNGAGPGASLLTVVIYSWATL
jgi:hypothetical protein